MGFFSIRVSPYGREKFDLGRAFQTSLKFVEYICMGVSFSDALSHHT